MKRKLFFILSCLIFTAVFPCQAAKWKAQHAVLALTDGVLTVYLKPLFLTLKR